MAGRCPSRHASRCSSCVSPHCAPTHAQPAWPPAKRVFWRGEMPLLSTLAKLYRMSATSCSERRTAARPHSRANQPRVRNADARDEPVHDVFPSAAEEMRSQAWNILHIHAGWRKINSGQGLLCNDFIKETLGSLIVYVQHGHVE